MLQGSPDNYVVITDTSCFILLDKINALDVLHLTYNNVVTTPQVVAEFKSTLPYWIKIIAVKTIDLIAEYTEKVDLGEASAIALAQEIPNSLLIVDDIRGRRLAAKLQITFTGTIGIFITARQKNILISLRPFFEMIKTTDFRISHIFT